MKFAKVLQSNAYQMPEEWRPYLIHYKALKKRINAIVEELEDRGLPSSIIKILLDQSMGGQVQRLEYSFDENQQHIKPCLRVVLNDDLASYGPLPPEQEEQLSQLLAANEIAFLKSASSSSSDLHEQLLLGFSEAEQPETLSEVATTVDFTPPLSPSIQDSSEDDTSTTPSTAVTSPIPSTNASFPSPSHSTTGLAFTTTAFSPPSPLPSPPLQFADIHKDKEDQDKANELYSNSCNRSMRSLLLLDHAQDENKQQQQHHHHQYQQDGAEHPDVAQSHSKPQAHDSTQTTGVSEIGDITFTDNGGGSEQLEVIDLTAKKSARKFNRSNSRVITTEEDGKRVLVIELTADTAFFDQLGEEISQLSKLQETNKKQFEKKVEDLSKVLTTVASPTNKDMYTWREILKMYLDAQVFVGDSEQDRSTRSSEKAQKQLQWFLKEVERSKLVSKFKMAKSKAAFNTFYELNSDLITMKQFKELNQMAMTKILKKHDKRTSLTASSGFPKHLQNEPFYNDNISKSLTYTIGCQLVSIIPQPDDYACPICMSIAWKPIRLNCSHVFCVRCLIKAQRNKMVNCPICRHESSVAVANATNLDVTLMNYMKLYFPKEIKQKRKDASREQAAEDLEILTGKPCTGNEACTIM